MIIIRTILWYLAAGMIYYLIYELVDHAFLDELVQERKREQPGFSNDSYWLVLAITVIGMWPLLLLTFITHFIREFFASCNRNLIDIFSSKKGANNETHGKNQEDTYEK